MSGSHSVFGRLLTLLHEADMSASDFVVLCDAYEIKIGNAAISRALKAQKLTCELEESLHPLIRRLENLVKLAGPFKISFKDVGHTKLLLDILDEGHTISAKLGLKAAE